MDKSSTHDEVQSSGHPASEMSATNQTTDAAKPRKPLSPRKCRDFIRRETANAMPKIVTKFIGHAENGSVPHFNALTKVGGFDQRAASADAPKRRRRSLARQLLDEVERYQAKQAAEHAASQTASQTGDPIRKPDSQERL